MTREPTTPRQHEALRAIEKLTAEKQRPPLQTELARTLVIQRSSASGLIRRLRSMGLLAADDPKAWRNAAISPLGTAVLESLELKERWDESKAKVRQMLGGGVS